MARARAPTDEEVARVRIPAFLDLLNDAAASARLCSGLLSFRAVSRGEDFGIRFHAERFLSCLSSFPELRAITSTRDLESMLYANSTRYHGQAKRPSRTVLYV